MNQPRLIFYAALLASCAPDLATDDSLVDAPRILAIKDEPPETKPGTEASYSALIARPAGSGEEETIRWRFCTAPKPIAENNIVSSTCLQDASLVPAGSGTLVVAGTSADACALFGPETPPGGFRSRDPDVTGGYYQPLRVDLPGVSSAFHLARLLCGLANAPQDAAAEFARSYRSNQNPQLGPLQADVQGEVVMLDQIPAGARVKLTVSWSYQDAEEYLNFDPSAQRLTARRESMRVAWYADAGRFDAHSTGRAKSDTETSTSNFWKVPEGLSQVRLWVVLRDGRGGVDFAEHRLTVTHE